MMLSLINMSSYLSGYLDTLSAFNKIYNKYTCKTDLLLDINDSINITDLINKTYEGTPLCPIVQKEKNYLAG
jgi:hypothetical protein